MRQRQLTISDATLQYAEDEFQTAYGNWQRATSNEERLQCDRELERTRTILVELGYSLERIVELANGA